MRASASAAGYLAGWLLVAVSSTVANTALAEYAEPLRYHRDAVLGTSLDVSVYGAKRSAADAAVRRMERELERLEAVLSTYRSDSELSRANRAGKLAPASSDLLAVLRLCEQWRERSAERFSCRMGRVIAYWDEAQRSQQAPDRVAVRALAWRANRAELVQPPQAVVLPEPVELAPDGLAKGYIIDRLAQVLRRALPGAAFKLDIGGDAIYEGRPPGRAGWDVGLADPVATADNGGFIGQLRLSSRAIAASGHHSRSRHIGKREYSHILQPRDGWPVADAPAAVVVADDAVTADAVATALAASTLAEGIDWVNTLEGVEALVIGPQGRQLASANWAALVSGGDNRGGEQAANLRLRYELPRLAVAEYHPPYVSIWISNGERQTVKNLLLLGESERWAKENRRWWRKVGRRDPTLLDGIARPTRSPGVYDLVWDGRDDFGRPLPTGDYTLHLEASREAGGTAYRQIPFVWGGAATEYNAAAQGEFGDIHLQVYAGAPVAPAS
ncbi:MAG: DUF2271 domain-containing protein [Parahaliea sp.]